LIGRLHPLRALSANGAVPNGGTKRRDPKGPGEFGAESASEERQRGAEELKKGIEERGELEEEEIVTP